MELEFIIQNNMHRLNEKKSWKILPIPKRSDVLTGCRLKCIKSTAHHREKNPDCINAIRVCKGKTWTFSQFDFFFRKHLKGFTQFGIPVSIVKWHLGSQVCSWSNSIENTSQSVRTRIAVYPTKQNKGKWDSCSTETLSFWILNYLM